ncbi:MAG: hotdog domain-containing protein [Candidatus Caldarchaeum sp.]
MHVERFRVGFQDTDSTTRVYFPSYVRWFDIAFIEYLRRNGVVFDSTGCLVVKGQRLDRTLVIGEYGCRITKPSKYDDMIEAHVTIKELKDKVVTADFVLRDAGNGEQLATGWIKYVCVSLENGRSTELPRTLAEIFERGRM